MMMGGTIAVTGASGAIGSHLLKRARADGRRVIALSRNKPADLPSDVPWRPFDVSYPDSFQNACAGADVVIHLASVICGETPDQQTAEDLWRVNVLGTRGLALHMAKAGVPRLILASTANFYAPGLSEANELSPVSPTSRTLYLGSKATQEWTAASLCEQHALSFAALRIASVVGTGRSVIDHFARRLTAGEPVTIARQGRFGADFVDVEDVVNGLLIAADQSLEGVWNVSSGERRLLVDIAADLALFSGQEISTAVLIDNKGDPDPGFPAINCEKLLSAGYRPTSYPKFLDRLLARARTDGTSLSNGSACQ